MILAALAIAAQMTLASATVVTIERRTVVRLVRRAQSVTPPPPPPDFKERRGPHCIAANDVSAAAVTGPAQVDFALRGGPRVRAMLEDECPALDFYRGFYLPPTADGRICAGRDVIRTRAGGECAIDRFRKLEPKPPPPPPKSAEQP